MIEKVAALAVQIGKIEDSEALRTLCQAAIGELTGLLRDGAEPENCGGAFELAAAYLALAGMERAEDDGVESFTVGEVSIRKGGSSARGQALREQAMQVMKPYLTDRGFLFRNV